ncbi:MAG: hypothetical protein ISR96_11190 [Nitrospira sp.]|nr:hypothetical protein [Nitrospira sp.]
MRTVITFIALLLMVSFAQVSDAVLSGSWKAKAAGGMINLELGSPDTQSVVKGNLRFSTGIEFVMQGSRSEDGSFIGQMQSPQAGGMFFHATMQGEKLSMIVMAPDMNGRPNPATATQTIFDRAEGKSKAKLPEGNNNAKQEQPLPISGAGGTLTADAANAYVDAVQFCLQQLGNHTVILPPQRQQIISNLALAYPAFPIDVQQNLAGSRMILNQHLASWAVLPLQQKQQFGYNVLSLMIGEAQAAQAVGLNSGGGSQAYRDAAGVSYSGVIQQQLQDDLMRDTGDAIWGYGCPSCPK